MFHSFVNYIDILYELSNYCLFYFIYFFQVLGWKVPVFFIFYFCGNDVALSQKKHNNNKGLIYN
jgi:hypothetical protein